MSEKWPGGSCMLYTITNKVNGMQYVGLSSTPERRFKKHCSKTQPQGASYINRAIQSYGKENFEFKVVLVADREYCIETEAKLIKLYNTLTPNGYNICGGGDGPKAVLCGERHHYYEKPRPAAVREKLRQIFTGRPISDEQKAKISASLMGREGHKTTDSAKQLLSHASKSAWADPIKRAKIVAGMIGKKRSEQSRESYRKARLGKSQSEQSKARQSETLKQRWADPEFRAKMIASRKKQEIQ